MKRQANTLSALIQNFDTAEKAIKASESSAGSALRENEVYLDSIQGKIDLLNNSVQTLWNNTLDSDAVKFFVSIGTQLVKWVDHFGLIKTLIFGIGTYLIKKNFKGDLWGGLFGGDIEDAKNKLKLVEDKITKLQSKKSTPLNQKRIAKLQGTKTETEKYIQEYDTLSEKLKKYKVESEGAKKKLDEFNTKLAKKAAKGKQVTDKDIEQQSKLNSAYDESNKQVQQTEAELVKVEMQANMTGTAGLTAGQKIKTGFSSAWKSVKQFAIEMAKSMAYMAIFQGIAAIIGGALDLITDVIDQFKPKTFEELHEEFESLSSELAESESELSNLEGALEDVDSQIREIQSLGSLSFTKQEELENLQKQSAELNRQIEMQKILTKNKQKETNSAALSAAKSYMQQSAETDDTLSEAAAKTKETGEKIGGIVDGLLMVGGAAMMIGFGWTGAGAIAGGAMMAAGMAGAGKSGIGYLGENVGESQYEKQQTNQQAIDSYATKRADYQKKMEDAYARQDAEEYDKIREEYDKFESMMADNIGGLLEYISSVDYDTLSDPDKTQYEAFNRMVNQYSLANNGSITDAIDSILDYDRYEQDCQQDNWLNLVRMRM